MIKEIIENRINKVVNLRFNKTPEEMWLEYQKNPEIYLPQKPLNNNLTKKNIMRRNITYKKGQEVLIRNQLPMKSEVLYIGPFTVEDSSRDGNRVLIKKERNLIWENIKNVKPYFREGSM